MIHALARLIVRRAMRRAPDFHIGGRADPYLLRWYLTPYSGLYRNIPDDEKTLWQRFVSRLPAAYVHEFRRSDDDRALHDHPWANCSILVDGSYIEHTIAAGGVHQHRRRTAGDIVIRGARSAHRVEIEPGTICRTLFVTAWRVRVWGFHCPKRWVPWREFVSSNDRGTVGAGCGED